MDSNALRSSFPAVCQHLVSMQTLALSFNYFEGCLPEAIAFMSGLRETMGTSGTFDNFMWGYAISCLPPQDLLRFDVFSKRLPAWTKIYVHDQYLLELLNVTLTCYNYM